MKKSKIVMLLCLLAAVPLTILLGSRLPGRSFYLTSTLVLIEIMLPFFLAFEGRKPQARELVVVAVLCALAIAGRVVIPIPNFKAAFGIIMLSAVALGPETGFLVGAVTALGSNLFLGQGPHTPWQMLAYGLAGLLAGALYRKKLMKRKPMAMALTGAVLVVLLVGPLLDTCTVFLTLTEITAAGAGAVYLAGLPVNLSQAAATFLTILILGEPFLQKLDRVKRQYGMMEDSDGI